MCKCKKCDCDILDCFGFFGVRPSRTIPPANPNRNRLPITEQDYDLPVVKKPKSSPPQTISEGFGEINFGDKSKRKSKLERIFDIIWE